jgi:hypothetical protein
LYCSGRWRWRCIQRRRPRKGLSRSVHLPPSPLLLELSLLDSGWSYSSWSLLKSDSVFEGVVQMQMLTNEQNLSRAKCFDCLESSGGTMMIDSSEKGPRSIAGDQRRSRGYGSMLEIETSIWNNSLGLREPDHGLRVAVCQPVPLRSLTPCKPSRFAEV